ncbi:hypothetical protein B0H14DRAFT_3515594 [Mycena olivaceomarginata]|nr:hypothetical protein B0H14DRAFT_3515594 [Mycena olivaceomarginata]
MLATSAAPSRPINTGWRHSSSLCILVFPPTYNLQTALPTPLLAPNLPYIALYAFFADWLHPALAPCFEGLEIVYPLRTLNAKTLLGSAPDSAPNPLPVWQCRLPLPS